MNRVDHQNSITGLFKLLKGCQGKETEAWNKLVEIYGPQVRDWIGKTNLPHADRDDIYQEVFLTVLKSIGMKNWERPEMNFTGWLRVITKSRIIDHFRWLKKKRLSLMDEQSLDRQLTLRNSHTTPLDKKSLPHWWYQRVLPSIEHIRRKLGKRTWDAFWGVIVEERSSSEVGKRLGLSAAGVRMSKSRVLRKLKAHVKQKNG